MKTPVLASLFNKVAGLQICNIIKRDSNTGLSCGYSETFRTAFLNRKPPVAASDSPTKV